MAESATIVEVEVGQGSIQTETQDSGEAAKKRAAATDYFKPLVAGDILESTASQQAIVVGSSLVIAAMICKTVALSMALGPDFSWPIMAAAILIGYEFADFGFAPAMAPAAMPAPTGAERARPRHRRRRPPPPAPRPRWPARRRAHSRRSRAATEGCKAGVKQV
jgi:hypothetical protein